MLTGKELGKAIEAAIQKKLDKGSVQSKAEIARHFGIQPPSIHDWIKKGSISKDKLPELWRYFSDVVSPEHWGLSNLDRPHFASKSVEVKQSIPSNVEPGPEITGRVPLISWVQAGQFCTSPDLFQPGYAEEWLPAVKKFGPNAYALRVVGDSMVLPYPSKDSFFSGTIIFVDPDKPLTNGAKVIAKIEGTEEATFKVYSEDGGKRYLKPQNPQYPVIEMDGTMHICGVVVWQGGDV